MKIERKIIGGATVRRYHLDGGDVVIVARIPEGRICSMTPSYPPEINYQIKPTIAAHHISQQRRRERADAA